MVLLKARIKQRTILRAIREGLRAQLRSTGSKFTGRSLVGVFLFFPLSFIHFFLSSSSLPPSCVRRQDRFGCTKNSYHHNIITVKLKRKHSCTSCFTHNITEGDLELLSTLSFSQRWFEFFQTEQCCEVSSKITNACHRKGAMPCEELPV